MQAPSTDRGLTILRACARLFALGAAMIGTISAAAWGAPGDTVTEWIRTECDAASGSATATFYYVAGYAGPPKDDRNAHDKAGQGGPLNISTSKAWCALPNGHGMRATLHNVPVRPGETQGDFHRWATVWIDKVKVVDVDLTEKPLERVHTDFRSYRTCRYDLPRDQDEGDLSRPNHGAVRVQCVDVLKIAGKRDLSEFPHLAGEGVIGDTGSTISCAVDPPAPTRWQLVSGFAGQRLPIFPQHPRQCVGGDENTCKSKAYLIAGDLVRSTPECDGWSYVSFTGPSRTTSGWVVPWRLGKESPDNAAAAASRARFRAELARLRVASALDPELCQAVLKGDVVDVASNPVTPYVISVEAVRGGVGDEHFLDELDSVDVLIVAIGIADIENSGHPIRFGIAQAGQIGPRGTDYEWPILLDETGMPTADNALSERLFRCAGDPNAVRLFRFGNRTYLERRRSDPGAPTVHEVWRFMGNAATRMCWIQRGPGGERSVSPVGP